MGNGGNHLLNSHEIANTHMRTYNLPAAEGNKSEGVLTFITSLNSFPANGHLYSSISYFYYHLFLFKEVINKKTSCIICRLRNCI